MTGKKKGRTIFRVLVLPFLCILAAQLFVLAGSLVFGGVMDRLNQNAKDILAQQVENRGNYLLNEMVGNWSGLNLILERINAVVEEKTEQGLFALSDLNENDKVCESLLEEMQTELIDTMYNKQVSGVFLILNTKSLDGEDAPETLNGIYLRDLDPSSTPSRRHEDILTERAPAEVVRSGRIATDTGWQPVFSREDSVLQPFFYRPYMAAYRDGGKLAAKEYGYWTCEPYRLSGDEHSAIAYSVPLLLEDGTVYGVLGVEILTDYLQSLLPCGELMEEGHGSYLVAVSKDGGELSPLVFSSESITWEDMEQLQIALRGDNTEAYDRENNYFGAAKPLAIYNSNAPFESDRWYLIGIGAEEHLFAFSGQIRMILLFSFILTVGIGGAGILYVSYKLSKPVRQLSKEVEQAKHENRLPELSDTGILEIDRFADAIVQLQQEVMDFSTRFLQIIDMASVDIAGYEVKDGSDCVFVTENYFPLLGADAPDVSHLTPDEFWERLNQAKKKLKCCVSEEGNEVYKVAAKDGGERYLRFEDIKDDGRHVGLVEDVTAATLERMRIERERDCDGLTKLYSRRGFRREADALFLNPDRLKEAALLMIDLDNLKMTNDKYGHSFGDHYIQTAGRCFLENTPKETVCARISGDEFLLFFHGYESREEISEHIRALYRAIGEVRFHFPDGSSMGLSASGGVAWYGKDSSDLSELMKYADFAMYQVKCSQKGEVKEFNRNAYQEKMYRNQNRLEFHRLIENEQVDYHFQPIFDGKTGEPFAYEALMRVDFSTLKSPETVLKLAREEGRMHDIERITMFRASEIYCELLEKKLVSDTTLLFLNSIASERMTEQEEREYHQRFAHIQSRVVVEITEAEHMDLELVDKKKEVEGFSGMFALDDYGRGYNSEINLLELKPDFVKVDITMVRDIDKDINKQQIVSNIVAYAHKRNMKIIAEGLETKAEVVKSLELGVDLLQGFFLACPAPIPPKISEEAFSLIQKYWE